MSGFGSSSSQVREYRDDPDAFSDRTQRIRGGYQGKGYSSFNEVSDTISNNIFKINNNVATLDRTFRALGTARDSVQMRDKIHDTEQSTNRVVAETVQAFKQLARMRTERPHRLQYERLSSEFCAVTERYNKLQKNLAEKVRQTTVEKPQKLIDFEQQNDDDEAFLVAEEQRRQKQQQEAAALEAEVALVQERETRIRQLEGDILDVNQIFKDLSALVHEQGEVIDTIEANVETASAHVEQGTSQLSKAATYQRKARKKIFCLIVILLIVAAIIAIILAVSLHK